MSITLESNIKNDYDELGFEYWNSEELEKSKPYYCFNEADIKEMYAYVNQLGVYDDLYELCGKESIEGTGISLGAGICWEAEILREYNISKYDFLDFSKHRIHKVAPYVIKNSGFSDICDISLIQSSYYDVPRTKETYDFIILSEALMMAEYPEKLLKECLRIIKKSGKIIVVGEPRIRENCKEKIIKCISRNKGLAKYDESGAHKYLLSDYKKCLESLI